MIGYHISWGEFTDLLPRLLPVLVPILLLQLVLATASLVSIFRKRLSFNQIVVWFFVVIFASIIGPVLYFALGSKMLDEKAYVGNGEER